MNPYLQIAREHLTTEELELLLAERRKLAPQKMTRQQKQKEYFREYLKKHL